MQRMRYSQQHSKTREGTTGWGGALIAWGRFFDRQDQRVTVPAPSTNPGAPWLLDFLAHEALHLRQGGLHRFAVAADQQGAGRGRCGM